MDRFSAGIQRLAPSKNRARMCIKSFSRRFRKRFHLSFGKTHSEREPALVMRHVGCGSRNELRVEKGTDPLSTCQTSRVLSHYSPASPSAPEDLCRLWLPCFRSSHQDLPHPARKRRKMNFCVSSCREVAEDSHQDGNSLVRAWNSKRSEATLILAPRPEAEV